MFHAFFYSPIIRRVMNFFSFSDGEDYEDESALGADYQLMNKVGLVEGALSELNHEHQLTITVGSFIDVFVIGSTWVKKKKFYKIE